MRSPVKTKPKSKPARAAAEINKTTKLAKTQQSVLVRAEQRIKQLEAKLKQVLVAKRKAEKKASEDYLHFELVLQRIPGSVYWKDKQGIYYACNQYMLHDITMERYRLADGNKIVYLSQREAQCMVCLTHGKSAKQTAKALDLSPRTIEFYLGRLKNKLDCKDRSEMIAKAMSCRFLEGIYSGSSMNAISLPQEKNDDNSGYNYLSRSNDNRDTNFCGDSTK